MAKNAKKVEKFTEINKIADRIQNSSGVKNVEKSEHKVYHTDRKTALKRAFKEYEFHVEGKGRDNRDNALKNKKKK